jgi:hypothetical protein
LNNHVILILCCFLLTNTLFMEFAYTQEEDSTKEINYPLVPIEAISEALMGIKMTPDDLSFRTDYVEVDPFRLYIIDYLTLNPLEMPAFVDKYSKFCLSEANNPFDLLKFIEDYLTSDAISRPTTLTFINPSEADSRLITSESVPPNIKYPDNISDIDEVSLDPLISKCIHFLELMLHNKFYERTSTGHFWGTEEEVYYLRDSFPELLLEDVDDEFKPMEVLDSLQKHEEYLSKRATTVCKDIKLEFIFQYGNAAFMQIDDFISSVSPLSKEIKPIMDSLNWVIEREIPQGRIAIGGWGENLYQGKYYFILDLGGDDLYQLDQKEGTQVIFDLDGNDTYIANDDYCLGSGFFGTGILYDLKGDDLYKAKNFSLGSGLFGIGFLIDEAGNDTYIGDTHSQGAGTFGIGMLIDKGGNDNYNCALFGQAFAGPDGFGSIVDFNGNDNYFAGGKYKDFLRYEDHFLSLSQGFSFGFRPRMSGGVAILIDSSGNDIYISDIFGQAASYWYGLGAMYDISGNDKYLSFQYAQGNGTHLSLGLLMDKSGDDYYYAKGVSQGCGHDLAAGILIDYAGNDTYQAFDLSQAAGSANGVGILIDYLGKDTYEVQSNEKTQGYGNPRRDYGSIGLFMDLMGDDNYIGNGQNNFYWIIKSRWGIGMDIDYWEVEK